jgi:hypothetical protein
MPSNDFKKRIKRTWSIYQHDTRSPWWASDLPVDAEFAIVSIQGHFWFTPLKGCSGVFAIDRELLEYKQCDPKGLGDIGKKLDGALYAEFLEGKNIYFTLNKLNDKRGIISLSAAVVCPGAARKNAMTHGGSHGID